MNSKVVVVRSIRHEWKSQQRCPPGPGTFPIRGNLRRAVALRPTVRCARPASSVGSRSPRRRGSRHHHAACLFGHALSRIVGRLWDQREHCSWRAWNCARGKIRARPQVDAIAPRSETSRMAFGLYYLGSDTIRSWTSDVHIGVGLFLPILFCVHVFVGRRSS
jgi:hypothetical protein